MTTTRQPQPPAGTDRPTALDPDAVGAAVAVGAGRIAAYADKHAIAINPEQCDELAESLLHLYQAFTAGVNHATGHTPPADE